MKVVIISSKYGYPGRQERIEYIINQFERYGRFEFIAFDRERVSVFKRGLHVLRVNEGDGASKCISYLKAIIGEERFFVIFETDMEGVDVGELLRYHRKQGFGITVAARKEKSGEKWKNLGIMLLENEYLDMICDGCELESDIVVKCAEEGDLGIYAK